MEIHRILLILVSLGLASSQVLNGYINPMWVTDRRTSRMRSDLYAGYTSGAQSLYPQRETNLVYMDDNGRYHPVYRRDRVFRVDPYYRVEEQNDRFPSTPVIN